MLPCIITALALPGSQDSIARLNANTELALHSGHHSSNEVGADIQSTMPFLLVLSKKV